MLVFLYMLWCNKRTEYEHIKQTLYLCILVTDTQWIIIDSSPTGRFTVGHARL